VIYSYPVVSLMAKFVAEGRRNNKPFERKCAMSFWMGMTFGCTAAILSMVFLPAGLSFYDVRDLGISGILYSLTYISSAPIGFCLYLLQAMGRVKLWALLSILNTASSLLILTASMYINPEMTVLKYFEIVLLGNALIGFTALMLSVRILGLKNIISPDYGVIREIFKAGLGGWIAVLCSYVALQGVNTMIAKWAGKTELGYYQLVATIAAWVYNVIVSVTVPALSAWSEIAAERRYSSLRRNFRFRQLGTASLAVIAAVIAFVFAPDILAKLYGEEYRSSYRLLQINVVAWITLGFAGWYYLMFSALGRPGLVMMPNVIWGFVQIVICYFLMKWFNLGAYGAMAAHSIAYICWALTYEVVFRKLWKELTASPPAADQEVSG